MLQCPAGHKGPWETTTLIGHRWKRSNAFEPSGTNCPTASVFFKRRPNGNILQCTFGLPVLSFSPTLCALHCHISSPSVMILGHWGIGALPNTPMPQCPKSWLVVFARGPHLFPFRTEKLSPSAPMVLPLKGGRVGRCQPFFFCPFGGFYKARLGLPGRALVFYVF